MCATSMVINDWFNHPSNPHPQYPPNYIGWPTVQKDPELAAQMLEVLNRLGAIDKRLNLMEQCKVDAKTKKAIKARLRRIAAKVRK